MNCDDDAWLLEEVHEARVIWLGYVVYIIEVRYKVKHTKLFHVPNVPNTLLML